MPTLIVPRRFRGPTTSANGGYICGLISVLTSEPVTVRLLSPPPLDIELDVVEREGVLQVLHGDTPVGAARPGGVGALDAPAAPRYDDALAAARRFAGFARHPAPECFVCGPERAPGDGLRIFCGALDPSGHAQRGVVAGLWIPDASLGDDTGAVRREHIWAALDCPGYAAISPAMRSMLLGEFTVRIEHAIEVGEPCVVVGWPLGSSGRKHNAGTALYKLDATLAAMGRATWIEPRA